MRCALTSRIFCVDFWSFLTLPEVVGSCARIRFDEYLWCHCRLTVIRDLNINSKKKIINSIQLGRKRDYACIEHEAGNLVRYVQPRILLICHFNLSVFFEIAKIQRNQGLDRDQSQKSLQIKRANHATM